MSMYTQFNERRIEEKIKVNTRKYEIKKRDIKSSIQSLKIEFLQNRQMYALTHNPTIYDSLVKQFWQTATVRTLANGTQQLIASIDSKEYTITEASVRSKLQLADATGIHNLSDAEIYAGLATLGYVTEGAAVDQGEGSTQPAEPHHTLVDPIPSTSQPSSHSPPHPLSPPHSPPHYSPPRSYEAPLPEGNTSGSAEDKGKEPEDQGRIIQDIDDDPLVSLVRESMKMKEKSTDFVTPNKASGEAQEEDISPTVLEAAKTLSKVASQGVSKVKSTDKGKRYRRRARSVAKNINTGLDAKEKINTGREEIHTGIEDVTHKSKEQIRQEEAGLEEAIRLQAQMDVEVAKQIHLDKMLAKRVQEEQELSEQQLKRKAEVQKAAQFYTEEDWDTIRAKLKANTEVVKSLQGESISNDDFAKRMMEMINEKKKFYAEQKAKAKRSKSMTQAQQREYTSTFIKNQSSWKLSQLKKLSFEEFKSERQGNTARQETSKQQRLYWDASTKGKVEVLKEEETKVSVKKAGMRRKQKARKGINIDKNAQDEEREAYMKDKVKDASSE
ncbi:hypothetical protein Tco_0333310 [Tanacetum coccineum]